MLVLLDWDWGVEADPSRQQFSVTSVVVIFNQWGLTSPRQSKAGCAAVSTVETHLARIYRPTGNKDER